MLYGSQYVMANSTSLDSPIAETYPPLWDDANDMTLNTVCHILDPRTMFLPIPNSIIQASNAYMAFRAHILNYKFHYFPGFTPLFTESLALVFETDYGFLRTTDNINRISAKVWNRLDLSVKAKWWSKLNGRPESQYKPSTVKPDAKGGSRTEDEMKREAISTSIAELLLRGIAGEEMRSALEELFRSFPLEQPAKRSGIR